MKIGVYGLGRFGVFWAQQLSRLGSVYGYSRTLKTGLPTCISVTGFDGLFECDVLVLCVAISAMEEAVRQIAPRLRAGMLVMDTCSVKVHPVQTMIKHLPEDISIIATHPMFGPDSGRNGVQGLPLVFSPVRCGDSIAAEWKTMFTRTLGLKLIEMTPEEHDREAAVTQGITHFIGRVLKEMDLKPSTIGTLGYSKLLEIIEQTCNDPYQLFMDLQRYNPFTEDMRARLINAMHHQLDQVGIKKTW
ncbi:MAG: prephenate dehydrogenase/arogenate dehydrogenase family protein [Spirochaetales bacterium]|nr:prephenate dehydrogenase/arogenate dehydrogenase family protein [Spirochaetales bacterium]